jgi:hypothetical protein
MSEELLGGQWCDSSFCKECTALLAFTNSFAAALDGASAGSLNVEISRRRYGSFAVLGMRKANLRMLTSKYGHDVGD